MGVIEFLTFILFCFFGTIWFSIYAVFLGSRRRAASREVDQKVQQLADELDRQKRELVDTILQYDSRVEQIERRVADLERAQFSAEAESRGQARIGGAGR